MVNIFDNASAPSSVPIDPDGGLSVSADGMGLAPFKLLFGGPLAIQATLNKSPNYFRLVYVVLKSGRWNSFITIIPAVMPTALEWRVTLRSGQNLIFDDPSHTTLRLTTSGNLKIQSVYGVE